MLLFAISISMIDPLLIAGGIFPSGNPRRNDVSDTDGTAVSDNEEYSYLYISFDIPRRPLFTRLLTSSPCFHATAFIVEIGSGLIGIWKFLHYLCS